MAEELATALMLVISGIATLKSTPWGKKVLLVGLGMVIYTEIVSPGYFAQLGQWAFVAMFAVFLLGAVVSVMKLLKKLLPERKCSHKSCETAAFIATN